MWAIKLFGSKQAANSAAVKIIMSDESRNRSMLAYSVYVKPSNYVVTKRGAVSFFDQKFWEVVVKEDVPKSEDGTPDIPGDFEWLNSAAVVKYNFEY